MAEYIEREALEVALNHRLNFLMAENGEYDHYTSGFDEAVTRVENFPAADVAPVRHARWVDNHCTACGMMPMGDEMWKHCDFEPPRFERFMDYCPSCGCRMDGERKENDYGYQSEEGHEGQAY